MKISKWVDMGAEVDIEIGLDDVRGTLAEAFANITDDRLGEPGPNAAEVRKTLNMVGQFLKALTDEQIELIGRPSRMIVGAFLAAQAKRYEEKVRVEEPEG
jgi:hypothetical protein